ncbi:MAG: LuxR family transcriptional regulator [Sphingomonas sp.]|uniref:LuxR family transcriptional regulator n=1 Tax=Sphingomonas sp. TaxID=28214 RepID=UPI0035616656
MAREKPSGQEPEKVVSQSPALGPALRSVRVVMARLAIADAFVDSARAANSKDELFALLAQCCEAMKVRYFALVQHVDFMAAGSSGIRLHNYPPAWQHWFDENRLGQADPIHRASHVTGFGFPWSAVPNMIGLTPADRSILSQARIIGIGDGFTVPVHVPGEINGSCSFAIDPGDPFPKELYSVAQIVGGIAFEAARRLSHMRDLSPAPERPLTNRQRDCVLWSARGKTDWEISQILGISHETVIKHLQNARQRYGVHNKAILAIRVLFDGLISFSEILIH